MLKITNDSIVKDSLRSKLSLRVNIELSLERLALYC